MHDDEDPIDEALAGFEPAAGVVSAPNRRSSADAASRRLVERRLELLELRRVIDDWDASTVADTDLA